MAGGFLQAAMGGIGGAADAAQRQARGFIDDERRLNLDQQMSQLQEQREMRLMEARERASFASKKRDVTELGPERQRVEREGRQAEFEQDQQNAPRKAQTEAEASKIKSKADREAVAEKGRDKGYLGGVRAEAQARHVESASSAASAEATRLDTATKRQLLSLKTKMADQLAKGDTSGAEGTQRQIEALGYTPSGKGNTEYDVEKVTTTPALDALGEPIEGKYIEKRERTERRRPSPASKGDNAPAKGPAVPEDEALSQARAAVAAGKSRSAVNARLRELGYKAQL
jgi:hypothetical protein